MQYISCNDTTKTHFFHKLVHKTSKINLNQSAPGLKRHSKENAARIHKLHHANNPSSEATTFFNHTVDYCRSKPDISIIQDCNTKVKVTRSLTTGPGCLFDTMASIMLSTQSILTKFDEIASFGTIYIILSTTQHIHCFP